MEHEKATLLQWLGFKNNFDFSKNTVLGGFLGFFLSLFIIALAMVSIAVLLMIVVTVVDNGFLIAAEKAEIIRNLGLLLAATVGLPFLVWRSIVAQKQVNVAEQGHITDRINEAVKGLGAEKVTKQVKRTPRYQSIKGVWKRDEDGELIPAVRPDGERIEDVENFEESVPNLEVRLGSIYGLERIAVDSPRDHIQIMEILCAYLRENTPAVSTVPSDPEPTRRPKVRIDIQAAITVIGRRTTKQVDIERKSRFRLDLSNTDLSGGDFRNGEFSGAMFHGARLEGAMFDASDLSGTQFYYALLNFASFVRANLQGTRFDYATINQPQVSKSGWVDTINLGKIYGICLIGADLSAVRFIGKDEVLKCTFGSSDTKLYYAMDKKRAELKQLLEQYEDAERAEEKEKSADLIQKISGHAFGKWSEYEHNDFATRSEYTEFMKALNLVGFPYSNG
ncbi:MULTISPECIES: pentapeptide repeat-containing protein [Thalassospira]|uniref:Pentapeptide repeat-containing protein n=2 Tax=Thalassospira TaxID=168934 RepID=A0A367WBJ3_9PROT|nr:MULTISPECIES: pentapeptide repeat-containing protein [Thalassospira]MDG4718136.1 pentapeptide repeat-containing protein [Thalassospira sp. FZY0004]RCK37902.1 hypothetical protein TH19_07725 [Thalassospira profundimaris]